MKVLFFILSLFLFSQCSNETSAIAPIEPIVESEPLPENGQRQPGPCQSDALLQSWPQDALPGTFNQNLYDLNGKERDKLVLEEIFKGQSGNLSEQVSPITVTTEGAEIVFCVFNDYLSLKEGRIPYRMPLGMTALQDFIAQTQWTLPTRLMVDKIYEQAEIHLAPSPIPASPEMTTTKVIIEHSDMINQELDSFQGLIAGHKKDIVISNRLQTQSKKIAIYGWHRLNGNPIQPLSTVHGMDYADYSHGVRLIFKTVWMNGQPTPLADILKDRTLALALSDEGPIHQKLINQYYR